MPQELCIETNSQACLLEVIDTLPVECATGLIHFTTKGVMPAPSDLREYYRYVEQCVSAKVLPFSRLEYHEDHSGRRRVRLQMDWAFDFAVTRNYDKDIERMAADGALPQEVSYNFYKGLLWVRESKELWVRKGYELYKGSIHLVESGRDNFLKARIILSRDHIAVSARNNLSDADEARLASWFDVLKNKYQNLLG